MKFSQIAKSLALVGSASAATYKNTSFVPSGSGYYLDGSIYFDLKLPNSGFTGFAVGSDASNEGFSFGEASVSGTYEPSGAAVDGLSADTSSGSLDIVGDVALTSADESIDINIVGALESTLEEYVAFFVVSLEGLPQLIEKRADQDFTITVTATTTTSASSSGSASSSASSSGSASSSASSSGSASSGSASSGSASSSSSSSVTTTLVPVTPSTVTDVTLITITSCSDHKCTEVPVTTGVTVITENETVYTTYCPLTATSGLVSSVSTSTGVTTETTVENETTVTAEVTYTTTYCDYYSVSTITGATEKPATTGKGATTIVTLASTSSNGAEAGSTSISQYKASGAKVAGSGLFAVAAVLFSMLF
ncbi:hypothetical protein C6P40_002395 [Pichia californica]|uniref:Uncharacterized protein n=1 Tax=Pichia californica TaxID=460514 RepID=A0A9P6WKH0_9ASCO|nr:hypothetical protein C6P42_002367 [[Candida] californica]KAG0687398.1 hypothetical protein C6P40_002395 [[Candida] californica]